MSQETTFYREVLDAMSDGVYFVDRSRRITYWSRGAERLSGYAAQDVVGRACRDGILNHVNEDGVLMCGHLCPLRDTMRDGRTREAHVWMQHADGHRHPVWVRASPMRSPDGRVVGAVEVFGDGAAVAATKLRLAELESQALTDPLTGLANRRHLDAQVAGRVAEWQRQGRRFGLLLCDIDHFKAVNDEHGHDTGDEVLRMVARTLSLGTRGQDVVGRYGGEEFLVVVPGADQPGLEATAERLRALVAASRFVAHRTKVEVTTSVGATLVAPGDTAERLLRRADALLYQAKGAGRDRCVFDPGPQEASA